MTAPLSRRERYREQTLAEIKDAARRQIAEAGAGSLSLNALAKSLGMAGPSLYRYFPSRDALLTVLLVDAFDELTEALTTAAAGPGSASAPALAPASASASASASAEGKIRAYAAAYRAWGVGNPALFELLFGTPVPGYAAPAEATGPAAARSLAALIGLFAQLSAEPAAGAEHATGAEPAAGAERAAGESAAAAGEPGEVRPTQRWAALLAEMPHADRFAFATAVRAWTRLHGTLALELRQHTTQIVDDPEALYAAEVDDVIAAARRHPPALS